MEYVYTAWFKDVELLPDDQDYDTSARLIINAHNAREASAWGDRLAHAHSDKVRHQVFLRSAVRHAFPEDRATLTVVQQGQQPSGNFNWPVSV